MKAEQNQDDVFEITVVAVSSHPDELVGIDEVIEHGLKMIKCSSVVAAMALVEELIPHVVLVDVVIRGAYDFVSWIKKRTGSSVILMSPRPFLTGMEKWGADGHIQEPIDSVNLRRAIDRLFAESSGSMFDCPESKDLSINESTAPLDGLCVEEPLQKHEQKIRKKQNIYVMPQEVVAIWGAKGGVGRTTIALNLANYLRDFSVLLIDLNFSDGPSDISVCLDLPSTPHIGRFVDNPIDRRKGLDDAVVKPGNASFSVLQTPTTQDQSDKVSTDDIIDLIDQARRTYQIIIMDLPADQTLLTLEAVDMASSIFFVTTAHAGSVVRTKALRDKEKRSASQMIVLNRFTKHHGRAREIGHFLDLPIATIIEEDTKMSKNIRNSHIFEKNDSVFYKSIVDISRSLLGLSKLDTISDKKGLKRLFVSR